MKFYDKTWFIWLMQFLFAPVGIFLMWRKKKYNVVVRNILSGVFAFWFMICAIGGMGSGNQPSITSNNSAITDSQIKGNTDPKAADSTANIATPVETTSDNKSDVSGKCKYR